MPGGERALGQRQGRLRDEFEPLSDWRGPAPGADDFEGGVMLGGGEQHVGAAVLGRFGEHPSCRKSGRFVPSRLAAGFLRSRCANVVATTASTALIPTSSQATMSNRRQAERGSCRYRVLTARCAIRMSPRRIAFCSALEASHRSPQWLDVVEGARRTDAVPLALEESLSEDVHLGLHKVLLCIR